MDLGMDLTTPNFGRNLGPDIRLHGITGTTNEQTYKKKIKLLTGYGLGMDLGMDLVHTKSEPKFGLDIQRETSSSLAGIQMWN